MDGRELVVGLDIGTTSVKAVLFDIKGKLLDEVEEMITTHHPEPGWAEQDPQEIETKAILALKRILQPIDFEQNKLHGIGFSTAMHSLICVDREKNALSNMIIWSDGRSSQQAEELLASGGKELHLNTGTPIHPMTPLVKLKWMKETNFEPYRRAAYFMTIKDYLISRWFNKWWIDYAMAASTGLYNLAEHDWDRQALHIAGISKEQVAEIVAPDTVLTDLEPKVAEQIGIPSDIPFVIGSADGQLANLGDGSILPGEVAISAGTSGAIRQFAKGAGVDPSLETFTYAFTKDTSIIGGATNNGGIVLQWLKDMLEFDGSHEQLIEGAAAVDPGAEGILFLPYVNGERAPIWNQEAKGNFYGLHIGHRREHIVRAVLEGIALNIYQIGKSLENVAGEPKRICVNGGLAKSEVWVQILADIFGKEIQLSETHHSAAWGAAWTALVGVGGANTFEEIKENISVRKVVQPQLENHQRYADIYQNYKRLVNQIVPLF